MHGIGFYSIISLLINASFLVLFIFMGIAAFWLKQSRAVGGLMMMCGILLQVVHLIRFGVEFISGLGLRANISMSEGKFFNVLNATWLISIVGLHIFAIGFFLHAKNQRGLQARVEELEHILNDVQQRGV